MKNWGVAHYLVQNGTKQVLTGIRVKSSLPEHFVGCDIFLACS